MQNITFVSLNLCLGLSNKKDSVLDHLTKLRINVCAIQETEIPSGFPVNILNCRNYNLELEKNTGKMRAGFYARSDTKYTNGSLIEDSESVINNITFNNDAIWAWNQAPVEIKNSKTLFSAPKTINKFVFTIPV